LWTYDELTFKDYRLHAVYTPVHTAQNNSSGMWPALTITLLSVQCNTLHGTEYKITCGVFLCMCVCVCAQVLTLWGPNISKTVRDRDSVTIEHL